MAGVGIVEGVVGVNNSIETTMRVQLGELCHVVTKGTTPTSIGLSFTDSGVPFLRIQNLSNKSVELENVLYVSEQTHQALKRSVIKPKDFLITIAGTIGKVAIVPDDFPECNCNQAVAILRFDYDKLNPQYLLHWLGTLDALRQISGRKVTATISNLSLGQIKQLKIPLPPLAEQQKIAAILDAADTLRQKDQQLIDHYTTLSQSLFLEMFGDPVANPMGWEYKTLGDYIDYLADIGSNGANKLVAEKLVMTNEVDYALMIRTVNFTAQDFEKNAKYVSKDVYSFFKKSQVFGGEMIMNKIGSAGAFWMMPKLDKPVSLGLNQFLIRYSGITPNFVYYFLSTHFGKQNIQSRIRGAATKSITKAAVRDLPIFIPPMEQQNQFAERIQQIEAQKQQAQASLKHSEALFNSLLQRAFSGELSSPE